MLILTAFGIAIGAGGIVQLGRLGVFEHRRGKISNQRLQSPKYWTVVVASVRSVIIFRGPKIC